MSRTQFEKTSTWHLVNYLEGRGLEEVMGALCSWRKTESLPMSPRAEKTALVPIKITVLRECKIPFPQSAGLCE